MFSPISWSNFLTCLGIGLIIYYLVIAFLYYWKEILQFRFLSFKRAHDLPASEQIVEAHQDSLPAADSHLLKPEVKEGQSDQHNQVNELLEKLGDKIAVAGRKKNVKEELLLSIQLLLSGSMDLQYSQFVPSIENYIQSNVENHCSIHLSEQEIRALWKK